jgi:phage tail tape measure protein, TP901 family|nr:MAG TPA: minor tail protein [Caudoviricetes sp.]
MADRSIVVKLTADASGVKSGMSEASAATKAAADAMQGAGQAAQGAGEQMGSAGEKGKTGLAGLAESARQNGAAWTTVGTAVAGVGAGLLGFAGMAGKTAADFDASMSSVQAATHSSADEMSQLREAAIQAGADTAFSATEAAAGIEELAKAGVSTKDILGGGLSGALDLAAAGEISVSEAAETAATAMVQFNLSGDKVTHVADLLAAGAGKAQGGVHDMAYALKQSGLVASQAGLSIEETTGSIAAFASAGLIGQDAGTSFKTMLQRLENPSKSAKNAMDDLGIHIYDAQGHFIGITAVAEQLQAGMKNLGEEERNTAMSTIFGSDAIRAANVLYNEGGQGIQGWIDKVNDAGYAAETARLKQDNLKGDLEKLGGSWETAMIKIGSSSQAPFRSIVQHVTSLVDKLGELDGSTQATIMNFSLFGGAALTAVGGLMVMAPKIVEIKDAMNTLGWTAGNLKGKLGEIATGMTTFGRAGRMFITAAMIEGVKHYGDEVRRTGVSVDEMTATLQKGGSVLDNLDFDKGKYSLEEYNHALADISRPSTWSSIQQHLASFADGITGAFGADTRSDLQRTKDALETTGKTLSSMGTDEAVAQFKRLSSEMTNGTNKSMIDLINSMPDFKAHLNEVAKQMGLTADDNTRLALALGQIDPNATSAASGTDRLDAAIRKAKEGSDQIVPSLEAVVKGIKDYGDAVIANSNSEIKFQDAIQAANEAVKENGQTLDITTEKGRKNQSALNDLASATFAQVQAAQAAGAGQDELQSKMQSGRDAFISAAESMGLTEEEAVELADKYGLIPEKVETTVTADTSQATENAEGATAEIDGMTGTISISGDAANADYTLTVTADSINGTTGVVEIDANNDQGLAGLQETVQTIDNSDGTVSILGDATGARWEKDSVHTEIDNTTGTVTISGNDQASGKVRTVKYNIDQLHDKDISITTHIKQIFTQAGHWLGGFLPHFDADGGAITPIKHYADAGAVHGPGGPRDDWIPAMLSNGEHVLTAAEVMAAGGQDAVYRLRKMIRDGDIRRYMEARRFADGGSTGYASSPSLPGASGGLDAKALRKALSGMRVELSTDGRNSFDGHLRNVADGRILTYDRLTRR